MSHIFWPCAEASAFDIINDMADSSFSERDQIIKVASEIHECRERLAVLEEQLDELLKASRRVSRRSVNGRRNSYGKTILEIMGRAEGKHVFHEDDLMREANIADEKKPSFRTALSRLAKGHEIIKTEPKVYRLAGSAEDEITGTSELQVSEPGADIDIW